LYEGKKFKPKGRNHFEGTTYILTGGNTFSAASLVAKTLREQEDVVIVGEETGGGAYGNTAWLIPDITLPNTGVRFRLPLFRLVIDNEAEKGRGVQPEVLSLPTVEAIRRSEDYKMEKVKELIRKSR
jgi:C-terminal processing protease CtpA/Prc